MKKIFLFLFTILLTIPSHARLNSKLEGADTELGKYGIPYYQDINQYQTLVGSKVKYLTPYEKKVGVYDKYFKGTPNIEYTITKVNIKSSSRIEIELTPVNDANEKKVKMFINNVADDRYRTIDSKKIFCTTNDFTTPLLLVDKFNTDRENLKLNGYEGVDKSKLEFVDMVLDRKEIGDYPSAMYIFKNVKTGEEYKWSEKDIDFHAKQFNDIGRTFSDPKIIPVYTVTDIIFKRELFASTPLYFDVPYYVVKNNISDDKFTWKKSDAKSEFDKLVKEINSGHFIAILKKVEKPSNSAIRYGKTTEVTSEKNVTKYSYIDNFIDILIFSGSSEFDFELKNVSDNTLKVVWNEAVYVDYNGNTSKIMHKGVKYSQREGDQPASTIIKGAKISDLATPTDKVYYSEVLKDWTSHPLFDPSKSLGGKEVKLMLPIQVKDIVNEYTFVFELKYVLNYPSLVANPIMR